MLPKKKRFSKHKIPKAKQQAHHHASSAASSSHHSAHIPHYSATTTASVTYANTMKDYVSPAARQKKKHMDMIAATLLKLHEVRGLDDSKKGAHPRPHTTFLHLLTQPFHLPPTLAADLLHTFLPHGCHQQGKAVRFAHRRPSPPNLIYS